jgi:hypothetical protein
MRTSRIGIVLAVACSATAGAAEQTMPRDAWMGRMETALPTVFCKPESYFRQCFGLTAEQCEVAAASSVRVCLKKFKPRIPAVLVLPADGARWGTDVGTCAGESFEIAHLKQKKQSTKCNDPTAWR